LFRVDVLEELAELGLAASDHQGGQREEVQPVATREQMGAVQQTANIRKFEKKLRAAQT
jgi:hypothetical protein